MAWEAPWGRAMNTMSRPAGIDSHGSRVMSRIGGGQARVEFSDRRARLTVSGREHDLELRMPGAQPHELRPGEPGRSDDSDSFHE